MATLWLAHLAALTVLLCYKMTIADPPLDARPVISCFRCVPSQANGFCADDQIGARVDCTAGRCLMMGAKFKSSGDVARLYDCDSSNIVDWAFQLFTEQGSDDLPPNTCKFIDFGSPSVIDTMRNYGMSSAVTALLRGTAAGADLEAQVDAVELCTCENDLCNSVDTNQKITLIPRGQPGPPQPQPPGPAPPDPDVDCGWPWWWILLTVLWVLLLLLLLSTLALWLYKRSKKSGRPEPSDPNRDEYRPVQHHHATGPIQNPDPTNPKLKNNKHNR